MVHNLAVNDDCWSSEEEELNFGGTMGVAGIAAIRSGSFVDSQYAAQQPAHALSQPVSRTRPLRNCFIVCIELVTGYGLYKQRED